MDAAESVLLDLTADSGDANRKARRDVAIAIRHITNTNFRRLLVPLLYDPAPEVADEAMESVKAAGTDDFVFVPSLIALLRNRVLKGRARAVLVSYGEPVIDALAFFMRDADEDIWVRRHIPGTIGQIPSQKSVDVLVGALEETDGFLRYKTVSALERLRREQPNLTFPREPIEALTISEGQALFHLPVSLPQPVQQEDTPHRLAAGRRAGAEDGAHQGPHLPAAGPDLSVEGHRGRRVDAAARRSRAAARAPRSISTTS